MCYKNSKEKILIVTIDNISTFDSHVKKESRGLQMFAL